jgi:hypothetical protein
MRQLKNVREAAGIAEWPDNARFGQAASIRAAQTARTDCNPFSRKRGMASNPIIGTIENAILRRKFVRIRDSVDCE